MSLAQFSVNTYVSTYMKFLGTTAIITGLIAGLFYGVAFVLRPFSGPAITIFNKKRLMIIVYAFAALINLGYAFFPSVSMFVIMRTLHGVQLAFYGSLALTVASESLPDKKMATGLGIYGLSGIFARAFGPGIASYAKNLGELHQGAGGGFTAIFLLAAFFASVSVIPCTLLPNKVISKEERSSLGAWYKNIVAKEALVPSAVMMLISMTSVLLNTYLIPFSEWRNISGISLYFTVQAAVTVVTRPIIGKMIDKYGPAKIFYPGIMIYLCSYLSIAFASSLTLVLAGAVFAAIGQGATTPALQTMAIKSVPPHKRGVASNTNYFGVDLGNFLGPSISGFILTYFNYSVMFILTAVPLTLAVIIFAMGWNSYNKNAGMNLHQ